MPDQGTALRLDQVRLQRAGRAILDGLTFAVTAGTITALLGPNGAGKTTAIRCCTGLMRPDHGTVDVLGHAPGTPQANEQIGLMPQSTGAWSQVTAKQLLNYLARLYAHPQPVDDLIAELGIGSFATVGYRRLSGGQQQLVNLAGALVGRPRLLFLDEPTAGLDPHMRRHVWELMQRLRVAGVTILLTTHAMDEAEMLADQIELMDAGRVVISGTVAELTAEGTLEEVFLAHTRARP